MKISWHIDKAGLDKAGPEDCAMLALIGAATFAETFSDDHDGGALVAHCAREHSVEAYRNYLERGYEAFIAKSDIGGAAIGYTLSGPSDLPGTQEGDVELKRIYTFSRFHGSGLGTGLLQRVIDNSAPYKRLLLGVYHKNHRALAFYRKQGFQDIGTRQFDMGGVLHHDLVLARVLDGTNK